MPPGAELLLPQRELISPYPIEVVSTFTPVGTNYLWLEANHYFPGTPNDVGYSHTGWQGEDQTRIKVVHDSSLDPEAPRIVIAPRGDASLSLRVVDERGHVAYGSDFSSLDGVSYVLAGRGQDLFVGYDKSYQLLVEAGSFDGEGDSGMGTVTFGNMSLLMTENCTTPGRGEIKKNDVDTREIPSVGALVLPQGLQVFFHDPGQTPR